MTIRVLHVSQPVDAGVANVVMSLVTDQLRRGWEPIVACPPGGSLTARVAAAGGVVMSWDATRAPGAGVLLEIARLRRIVHRTGPDVVHLHGSKAGLAGRLAVRGTVPTVFQPHLWSFASVDGPIARAASWWEVFAARWTARFVCVSRDEHAAGIRAGVRGRFTVIPNGVDLERFGIRDRVDARNRLGLDPASPIAVCIARLAPLKGHDLLLQAWEEVRARLTGAQLVIVGDGPLRQELRERYPVARSNSVSWAGWSCRAVDYLAAATVVVVPSRAEGMALVPLEAMASGRAVVACDAGGIRESLGAETGAIVAPGDAVALAREIHRRLVSPAWADAEGRALRIRAESEFDERDAARAVAAVATEIAEGQASARRAW